MDTPITLDPSHFAPVAPVVAQIITNLLRIHPWLATLRGVQAALLGVTVRYGIRLRSVTDLTPPELDAAEIRRALLFLMNTARPLPSDPSTSAVDQFVVASAEIMRSARNVPDEAGRATRAFELAIARIVPVARTATRAATRSA